MFWEFQPQELTSGLLRANKTIHSEASSVLYSQNRFDLTFCDAESFLEQIGRENASCILYIRIDFPQLNCLNLQDITLKDDSSRVLAKIKSDCTRLKTLEMSLDSTNEVELVLDSLDNLNIAAQALLLVDERFRGISSLQNIIVEVYENGPSEYIRNKMKNHGWTINTTELVGGLDFYSDIEDFGYHDYYSENDSDF